MNVKQLFFALALLTCGSQVMAMEGKPLTEKDRVEVIRDQHRFAAFMDSRDKKAITSDTHRWLFLVDRRVPGERLFQASIQKPKDVLVYTEARHTAPISVLTEDDLIESTGTYLVRVTEAALKRVLRRCRAIAKSHNKDHTFTGFSQRCTRLKELVRKIDFNAVDEQVVVIAELGETLLALTTNLLHVRKENMSIALDHIELGEAMVQAILSSSTQAAKAPDKCALGQKTSGEEGSAIASSDAVTAFTAPKASPRRRRTARRVAPTSPPRATEAIPGAICSPPRKN